MMSQAKLSDRDSSGLEEKSSKRRGRNLILLSNFKARFDCEACGPGSTQLARRKDAGTPGIGWASPPSCCSVSARQMTKNVMDHTLQTSPGQASGQHTEGFGSCVAGSTQTFITVRQHSCGYASAGFTLR